MDPEARMSQSESPHAAVRRLPERGVYDRKSIYAIIDEAMICHVGFVEDGAPVVIPTIHARSGDELYFHGSRVSRLLKTIASGAPLCVTITLVDGIVVARSAFHSSMNYRSVVLYGSGREVVDPVEKDAALARITEHVIPRRWSDVRLPTPQELAATMVAAVAINEASAKVRTGPPKDAEADYSSSFWAGVIPVTTVFGTPLPDPRLTAGPSQQPSDPPAYLRDYRRPG